MVELIQQYVSAHKQVSIKGWGTLELVNTTATVDFPNRLLHGPVQTLQFTALGEDSIPFLHWLAAQLKISFSQAQQMTEMFAAGFHQSISLSNQVEWKDWCVFTKNADGSVLFQSELRFTATAAPVTAERVIRKGAGHTVRVGEEEKTNVEMEEYLQGQESQSVYRWWIAAVLLLVLGGAALFYVAGTYPMQWKHQSGRQKIELKEAPAGYRMIQ